MRLLLGHRLTQASGGPNLNLTPEEKRAYGQLFRQADTDSVGVVTGEVAVKFFEKTRLDSRVLGEVSLDTRKIPRQDSLSGAEETDGDVGYRYGRLPTRRTGASSHPLASASSCGLLGTPRPAASLRPSWRSNRAPSPSLTASQPLPPRPRPRPHCRPKEAAALPLRSASRL